MLPEAIIVMRAIFVCMMFWFASLFMPKEKALPSVTMMKWMFLFFTLALALFCLPHVQHVPIFHRETFNMTQLCALLYLLFRVTFVTFMLIPMALKHIRPIQPSMYNYAHPIVASVIAIAVG